VSEPVVVDTNVVVAGLLTARADSPVCRVLDGMLAAAFPFALSEALLAEYREVLVRPRIHKAHGLTAAQIETVLVELARHAIVLAPVAAAARAPDAGDQHLWDLLEAHRALRLVTGDKRLLASKAMVGRALTAADFLRALG
jgi:putative PIN family toxin of toxin-antitoxin system